MVLGVGTVLTGIMRSTFINMIISANSPKMQISPCIQRHSLLPMELPSVCLPIVAVATPLPTFAGMAADLTRRKKPIGGGACFLNLHIYMGERKPLCFFCYIRMSSQEVACQAVQ